MPLPERMTSGISRNRMLRVARKTAGVQHQLQRHIPTAQGKRGIELGGSSPHSWPSLSLVEIFARHAQDESNLQENENQPRPNGPHAATPVSTPATIRRRVYSSAQPP